jgi:hypothetical protein
MPEPVSRPNRQQADRRLTEPGYHDPTAGFMGAPPAYSALNLRLVLAAFGLVVCAGAAVAFAFVGTVAATVVFALLAVIALVDLVVVIRRRAALHRL